jgi:hypothetical protein
MNAPGLHDEFGSMLELEGRSGIELGGQAAIAAGKYCVEDCVEKDKCWQLQM